MQTATPLIDQQTLITPHPMRASVAGNRLLQWPFAPLEPIEQEENKLSLVSNDDVLRQTSRQQFSTPEFRVANDEVPKGRLTGPVKLIKQVARAWGLTNNELAKLLAYSTPQQATDLLEGRLTFSGSEDREDRARIMYFIHDTLSDLFVEPDDELQWIRKPLVELGNLDPITFMISRRIPGMIAVRHFVEGRLANR